VAVLGDGSHPPTASGSSSRESHHPGDRPEVPDGHLDGDVYFRVHREGHNLDRARTQFALVRSLEEKDERLSAIVQSVAAAAEPADLSCPGVPAVPVRSRQMKYGD